MPAYRVLIADDEESLRFVMRELLVVEGCDVVEAADGAQAVELARREPFDLYVLDVKMPRLDGLSVLRTVRQLDAEALVVMITAFDSQSLVLEALQAGAYDYFSKPFNVDELRIVLLRALEKQRLLRKVRELEKQLGEELRFGRLIGHSPAMQKVYAVLERVAEHDITVLITGESGTGKELVARAIHEHSPRRDGPFVTVNCAAIPEPLLESELFGHERGAFTGAVAAKPGKFELAQGGTIMLDEIGEMPPALQAKLLRVLQQREIERVGATAPRVVDIRVLAATNRDLRRMVAERTFREDLYFRINVMPVEMPALRERAEDLPALVAHFIRLYNARLNKRLEGVAPEAMARLERHGWPGNIRELENVIQRAMVMTRGAMIGVDALPEAIAGAPSADTTAGRADADAGAPSAVDLTRPMADQIDSVVEAHERRIIEAALERMQGRRQETADLLGISRKSLHNKMKKYGME